MDVYKYILYVLIYHRIMNSESVSIVAGSYRFVTVFLRFENGGKMMINTMKRAPSFVTCPRRSISITIPNISTAEQREHECSFKLNMPSMPSIRVYD